MGVVNAFQQRIGTTTHGRASSSTDDVNIVYPAKVLCLQQNIADQVCLFECFYILPFS